MKMARTRMRACSRGASYYDTRAAQASQPRTEQQTPILEEEQEQEQQEQKQEEEEEEEEGRNEQERETDVTIEGHDVLDCYICFQPLHPPLFTCNLGHVACPTCVTKFSNNCQICAGPIGNTRMIALEKILEASKISCPNKPHGCPARIPYYKKSEHKTSCPYCLCFCPEISCNFASSPKLLLEHAKDVHNPLVHKFKYGVTFYACISDSFRFKVLEDREDRMFLLSLNYIGQGIRALSLVCVCAPGSCEPEFSYKLTLERDVSDASSSNNSSSNNKKRGRRLKFSGPVMNSTLEERMSDDGLFLLVPDSGANKEFSVSVCVKVCGSSELKKEVA